MSISILKRRNNIGIFCKTFNATDVNANNLDLDGASVQNLITETITSDTIDSPIYTSLSNNVITQNVNIVWSKSLSTVTVSSLQNNVYNNLTVINGIDYIGSNIQNCKVGNHYTAKCAYTLNVSGTGEIDLLACFGGGPLEINNTIGIFASGTTYAGAFEYNISVTAYNRDTGALSVLYSFSNMYVSLSNINNKDRRVFSSNSNFVANDARRFGIFPISTGMRVLSRTGTAAISVTRVSSCILQNSN